MKARKAATNEIVVLEDVVKIYDDRPVLNGVSFTVREGEHVTLVGESTSGKSTIFKLIVGLVKPEAGRVSVFGQDINALNEKEQARLRQDIEMQFQSGALFDSLKVNENIRFMLDEQTRISARKKNDIIDRLLKGVNLLSAKEKFPYELSGGMKKRVAVARALATSPRLVLFDEPAAGLDPVTTARIVNLIKSLVAEHPMTVMVATTDVHLAMNFSKRVLILKEGRIHADALWTELKSSHDEYTQKFLNRALHL